MAVPVSEGQSLPGPPLAYDADLERLEIELLLEGVYACGSGWTGKG